MKVLHVTFDMRIGGTEMVIKAIIEGFAQADPDVDFSLFCIEHPLGPWGQELASKGIAIESYRRHPGFDWTLIRRIRRLVQAQAIDVLHCHQYTPWVYGLIASLGTGARVIFTEHGRFYPDSRRWKRTLLNPWFARLTSAITAISGSTKQALVDYEAIKPEDVVVIYNGIAQLYSDNEEVRNIRARYGLDERHFLFGTVSRFDPIKNQTMMLRAFSRVVAEHADARLLLVGDGEERMRLETLVHALGLDERVFFTGYITDPVNYIAAMDIFLLSSLSEGTSMTLLEAMSLGKPCVVTDAGGNAEVVARAENGIVTPNDDEMAFATAMKQMVEQPDLREAFSRGAFVRFNRQFSVEHMVKAYDALYKDVVSRR
ncbi:glycosyltransferase [Lamprobacter modestohalophilus]|uniref:Glycosyltransferase n=1 Tax=Lamprobacter modestohalophilus TaxID=1064514 RepID=A0A9X1B5D4_9GAMM|nr:glycosyltransferase [Lamprobacter modestohalophilus]MBK1619696.1 glycosyltransferase [Lamprobacter modestohalophilus]